MPRSKEMWRLASCSLFLLLLSTLDALAKIEKFRYSGFRGRSRIPPLVTTTAAKKGLCAIACVQTAACESFSFDAGAGGCSLFSRMIMALDVDPSVPSEDAHFSRVLASCPTWKDYVRLPGTTKCIRVGNAEKEWTQAAEACAEDGGHLLIIENADVMKNLQEFLEPGARAVGFNDINKEGQLLWLDGTPVDQAMFAHREPSDEWSGINEDCGMLLTKVNHAGLHDYPCSQPKMFICSLPTEK